MAGKSRSGWRGRWAAYARKALADDLLAAVIVTMQSTVLHTSMGNKVYAKALAEVGANQLSRAHEMLEEARDIMADLRRRNQVITCSDHMNACHAEMEHVL